MLSNSTFTADKFQYYVVLIASILMVVLLFAVGYLLYNKQITSSSFPPQQSKCPSFWTASTVGNITSCTFSNTSTNLGTTSAEPTTISTTNTNNNASLFFPVNKWPSFIPTGTQSDVVYSTNATSTNTETANIFLKTSKSVFSNIVMELTKNTSSSTSDTFDITNCSVTFNTDDPCKLRSVIKGVSWDGVSSITTCK